MENVSPEVIKLANHGIALAENGHLEQAVVIFRAILNDVPQLATCRAHLAHTLLILGDWSGAIESYTRAVQDGYKGAESRWSIGAAYSYLGDLERALDFLSDPGAELQKGFVLLAAGRLKEGWQLFHQRDVPWRNIPPAYWLAEDLTGKTIFVWPEWVLGDHLLFASLIPELIARAARVIIECKPSLYEIFKRSFPEALVMSQVEDRRPIAPPSVADYQIPLNHLGLFFRRDFTQFPKHNGYLVSDPARVRAIRQRYEALAKGRRIVGLGWRSKNELHMGLKCSTLIDWAPLLKVPGIFFVSLLTGEWGSEIKQAAESLGVHVYRDGEITDGPEAVFAHAAAMDLIISTSNTVIHAAGTQNIPGWLILPRGAGCFWYWFTDRDDSPWYPSLRLFRRAAGDIGEDWWREPLERAAIALHHWSQKPRSAV